MVLSITESNVSDLNFSVITEVGLYLDYENTIYDKTTKEKVLYNDKPIKCSITNIEIYPSRSYLIMDIYNYRAMNHILLHYFTKNENRGKGISPIVMNDIYPHGGDNSLDNKNKSGIEITYRNDTGNLQRLNTRYYRNKTLCIYELILLCSGRSDESTDLSFLDYTEEEFEEKERILDVNKFLNRVHR